MLVASHYTDKEAREILRTPGACCEFSQEALYQYQALLADSEETTPVLPQCADRSWRYLPQDYTGWAKEKVPCRIHRTTIFILNLFSGQRRHGDIQTWMEGHYTSTQHESCPAWT
eukprot:4800754-Pyramimonas_sp.AAC.1